jgi:phage gpG-like protein
MDFRIDIDASALGKAIATLDSSLTGFKKEMTEIQGGMRRATDVTFRQQGRPKHWAPDKPATIKARRRKAARTGKEPVAGYDTILRETDALRRDVISPTGNASEVTDTEAIEGTDQPQARRLQEGDGIHDIPARRFLDILPEQSREYQDIIGRGIHARVVSAMRGSGGRTI